MMHTGELFVAPGAPKCRIPVHESKVVDVILAQDAGMQYFFFAVLVLLQCNPFSFSLSHSYRHTCLSIADISCWRSVELFAAAAPSFSLASKPFANFIPSASSAKFYHGLDLV